MIIVENKFLYTTFLFSKQHFWLALLVVILHAFVFYGMKTVYQEGSLTNPVDTYFLKAIEVGDDDRVDETCLKGTLKQARVDFSQNFLSFHHSLYSKTFASLCDTGSRLCILVIHQETALGFSGIVLYLI